MVQSRNDIACVASVQRDGGGKLNSRERRGECEAQSLGCEESVKCDHWDVIPTIALRILLALRARI